MKTNFLALSVALLAVGGLTIQGQIVEDYSSTTTVAIPDRGPVGPPPVVPVNDAIVVAGSAITSLTDVNVLLEIQGDDGVDSEGWNGDLKVTLTFNANTAVLLNRVGLDIAAGNDIVSTDAENTFGYSDNGFARDSTGTLVGVLRLDDQAAQDIHRYRLTLTGSHNTPLPDSEAGAGITGTPATGDFQPDGRDVDGDVVTDGTARTALLAVFNGLDPNGTWTLTLADHSNIDSQSLQGWTLELTGVPEPEHYASIFGLLALGAMVYFRRTRGNRQTVSA